MKRKDRIPIWRISYRKINIFATFSRIQMNDEVGNIVRNYENITMMKAGDSLPYEAD